MKGGSQLFRKYARILFVCMGGLTSTIGLIHMLVVANVQLAAAAHLLDAQASTAKCRIETFLDNTVSSLKWIDDIDEPGVPVDYDAIRDETYRLFRRAPSIIGVGF